MLYIIHIQRILCCSFPMCVYHKTETKYFQCLRRILQYCAPLRKGTRSLTHFLCFVFALEVWSGHLFSQRSVGLLGLLSSWKHTKRKHDENTVCSRRHLLAKERNCFISHPCVKGLKVTTVMS